MSGGLTPCFFSHTVGKIHAYVSRWDIVNSLITALENSIRVVLSSRNLLQSAL